ncbi:MAG: ECF transporter S component [Oscillospiraceae bacterium]|jgi:ECF transporter S component (folate family)|nr:ECF transporter S component [Oscillospiraceae bacterium]
MSLTLRRVALSAVLVALIVVTSRFVQIPLFATTRLDLSYAIVMVAALLLGPLYGGTVGFLARAVGDLAFSGGIKIPYALGSAAMGAIIGLAQKYWLCKISNKALRFAASAAAAAVGAAVGFIGIVPALGALLFGAGYMVVLAHGATAALVDTIVASALGYPLYRILVKTPAVKPFEPIK